MRSATVYAIAQLKPHDRIQEAEGGSFKWKALTFIKCQPAVFSECLFTAGSLMLTANYFRNNKRSAASQNHHP
jgi:hypothetical protein